MNPNNPNFRNAEEWEKCHAMQVERVRKLEAEVLAMRSAARRMMSKSGYLNYMKMVRLLKSGEKT